ncbi:MAG: OmpA family protein, partial [Bryobacteraceae bacterium]
MFSKRKITIICMALSLVVFGTACKKKVPPPPPPPVVQPPPPPPPPPPKAPVVAQFAAEPSSIQRGESSTLRWEVTGDTTNISINQGIGTVRSTGSQRVQPNDSTTYTLTATG